MTGLNQAAKEYRILSVDGGGIYGLVSALWLKSLCQADASFLEPLPLPSPHHQYIFAGASAGAVTVLLMARDTNPRKALLNGDVENFWKSPIGAFSNKLDPVAAWFSLWGIGGWTGERDFQQLLESYFGDLRLGDLKHPVIITTFDWTSDFKPGDVTDAWPPPLFPGTALPAPRSQGRWRPRVITNLQNEFLALPVKKVAYWAATPPGLRTVRNALADAATYGANPSLDALTITTRELLTQGRDLRSPLHQPSRNPSLSDPGEAGLPVALLSVGNGNRYRSFWLQDFNLGTSALLSIPTNPYQGHWFPPEVSVSLDAPMEQTNELCTMLLGEQGNHFWRTRYLRLDPGIMPVPVLVASLLAKWDVWRDYFTHEIERNVQSLASREALGKAAAYLQHGWWMRLMTLGAVSDSDERSQAREGQ